jgi:DNA repair protein RadC
MGALSLLRRQIMQNLNLNLFGEPIPAATKKIVIRCIQARNHNEIVREDAPWWVSTRYSAPSHVHELLKHLVDEAKEHFIVLHLDGKNRINCIDRVAV